MNMMNINDVAILMMNIFGITMLFLMILAIPWLIIIWVADILNFSFVRYFKGLWDNFKKKKKDEEHPC